MFICLRYYKLHSKWIWRWWCSSNYK